MRQRLGVLATVLVTIAATVSCSSAPPAASPTLVGAPTVGTATTSGTPDAPTAAPTSAAPTSAAPTAGTPPTAAATGAAPTASPPASDGTVAAVEVAPGGVLLSRIGETKALTAVARNAAGQVVQAPVSWTSSDPAVVSVDGSGTVEAAQGIGTALITAAVGDIQSLPVYVTVAQPVPGALLINDGQVVAGPTVVDATAEPAADNPYEVVLRGVGNLAPDAILIGTEALSVAGRVVSATPEGGDVRVRLVVVPPTQLFSDFAFKDSVDLSQGAFEIPADLAAAYDIQQTGSTFDFTPKAASAGQTSDVVLASLRSGEQSATPRRVLDGVAQGTRALPPLPPFKECTATLGFGSGLPVPLALSAPPSFTFTAVGEALREATPLGTKFIVRATPTFKFSSLLEIRSAFEAKVECKLTLVRKPFRVPGWAGVFFGGDVEFGIGFEVGGKVTLFAAKVGGTAQIRPTFEAALDCPTGADCALSGNVTATTETTPILEAPSLDQAQFEPSVSLFGFISLEAGNADIEALQFKAIQVKAGANLGAGLALEALQMSNTSATSGRSKYALSFTGEVGPGIKLGDFLTYLGLSRVVPLKLSFALPLGESPTGSVKADQARYLPGERVTLTVTLAPATTLFPSGGLYNVDRVVVLRRNGLSTEVLAEQAATEGQTDFTLAFDAPGLLNAEELFAFVVTRLLPLDPPKLEIGSAQSGSEIIDLGTLGGSRSNASRINESGQILGQSVTADNSPRGFVWENGVMRDLCTRAGNFGSAVGINDAGQVVGQQGCGFGSDKIFLWQDGMMHDLHNLGAFGSFAFGINNAGQIVGQSVTTPGADAHAFLWQDGAMRDLGTLGGVQSTAVGINESGQVVGFSQTANGSNRAFLWQDGALRDLGTLGGSTSAAGAINESGQVVGQTAAADGSPRAFLWQDGSMSDLGTLGGSIAAATAINDSGQIVGISTDARGESRPFLWQDGVMTDLNDLIDPASGWVLSQASGINNAGWIVGQGTHDGQTRGFMLLP